MTRPRPIFAVVEKHLTCLVTMKHWHLVLSPMLKDGIGTPSMKRGFSIALETAMMEPCIGMVIRLKMVAFLCRLQYKKG